MHLPASPFSCLTKTLFLPLVRIKPIQQIPPAASKLVYQNTQNSECADHTAAED